MTKPHKSNLSFRPHPAQLLFLACTILAGCCRVEPIGTVSRGETPAKGEASTSQTALDRYVAAPDPSYSYRLLESIPGQGATTFVLELTSQSWLTTNEVDRPLWKHWVIITRPDTVASSKALLFIGGGANGGAPPKSADGNLARVAVATRSVIAELKMVPNQPLVFGKETEGRKEDSLICYTWDKFLRTGDTKWPARLPMTKAAVRAMDAVTAFCSSSEGGSAKIDGFVVAGGSKRGWTTWTTAAVDKRVVAIIPVVIDVLNVEACLMHHYGAYGFWAPAIGDYSAFRIMDWTGTPELRALMKIEDPYEYRDRLTMPKFMINASGDQFFLPDSSQFYFNDLPGVKYLRYVPNADHSLKGSDAYETLATCYSAVLHQAHLPQFGWTLEKDGSIRVTTKDAPAAVTLWQATNPDARDFRLETLGPKWQGAPIAAQDGGIYVARITPPVKGWTAFFAELTFPGVNQSPPFKFTTQVRVLPDTLPYKFVPKPPR